jgi:hypothetical protein
MQVLDHDRRIDGPAPVPSTSLPPLSTRNIAPLLSPALLKRDGSSLRNSAAARELPTSSFYSQIKGSRSIGEILAVELVASPSIALQRRKCSRVELGSAAAQRNFLEAE